MLAPAPPCAFIRSTDGVEVAVHNLGGPEDPAAPVVLFSHATGFHGRVFAPLASALRSRYACLALDYRGHGLTRLPDDAGLAWEGMGDDALAVLVSHLIGPDRPVHGVGHSMGGAALVLAASRRPGVLNSLWLYEPVLVPPGTMAPSSDGNLLALGAARRRPSFGSLDEAVANYASKPPLNQLHPDALDEYVRGGFADQPDGTVRLRCEPATEAAVFGFAADSGAWQVLPRMNLPVAVVAGRSEDFGPSRFAPLAVEAMPRATLLIRSTLGHFGPLEDPAGMAVDLEAWLTAHP
ncbi:MAG TPA: alpha/beta fold hydrolase [Acidimicrobiales bacterium]|nr:alpha/beta fold hydrolase [Acidimicrobiales bacterium]